MNKNILIEVLVFKTNILTDKEVDKVNLVLSKERNIIRWSIDREDADRVLRIECDNVHPLTVTNLLHNAGFFCEELPD